MTTAEQSTLHAALDAAVAAHLERLAGDAPHDQRLDLVAVEPLARRAGCPARLFVEAARRGAFPALLRLSERAHFVQRGALLEWAKRAELGPDRRRAVAAHLDDSPAEPFESEPVDAAQRRRRQP